MTMEKSNLRPELQTIVDQFTKFRIEYTTLKTNYSAQEELINLQKMELERLNKYVDKLATAMIDYQKRFNSTLHQLESENVQLQKSIDKLKSEYQISRNNENEYIEQARHDNNEYIQRLEDELEELRSEMTSKDSKYEAEINLLTKRHNEEILEYKKKVEEARTKLSESNVQNKTDIAYTHPAFDDDDTTARKRKKYVTSSSVRRPGLDVSVKKEVPATRKTVQRKRKKLYTADDEAMVDLVY